jgi:hypothetical protein
MKKPLSSSLWAAALLMGGLACGPGDARPQVGTTFVAIDTSDSAAGQKGTFYQATLDGLMALPLDSTTVVYRFDAKPAEIHSGSPPHSTEDAAKLLKRAVDHRTDQRGTNLAKLILLISQRIDESPTPAEIIIYTDCGTELMTEAEKQSVQRMTGKWAADARVRKLTFLGVRDGYREQLRDMIKVGPGKFGFGSL